MLVFVCASPHQVEWEFWTNSNDMCGAVCDVQKEFIKVQPLALAFHFAVALVSRLTWQPAASAHLLKRLKCRSL